MSTFTPCNLKNASKRLTYDSQLQCSKSSTLYSEDKAIPSISNRENALPAPNMGGDLSEDYEQGPGLGGDRGRGLMSL